MKKEFYRGFSLLLLSLMASCSPEASEETVDYTELSPEARLEAAKEMAQEFIMVDGHVDLPYRMKVGGFTLQREALRCVSQNRWW